MIIGLFGPHAIGKTTAVRRWVDLYHSVGLVGVFCDNQLLYDGETTTKEKGWQGSTADKQALLAEKREQPGIFVLESCASYGTQLVRGFTSEDYLIHVYCSALRLQELIRNRCERKGRTFNAEYWKAKADYECFRRMDNCIRKNLHPSQVTSFQVEDQARDWPVVDEYFTRLFARLHNKGRLRRRR